jgi:hypothetical protein
MIHLIITACLIADPSVCRTFELPLTETEVSLTQCFMIGQLEVAKPGGWADQNPKWQFRSLKCGKPAPSFEQHKAERDT